MKRGAALSLTNQLLPRSQRYLGLSVFLTFHLINVYDLPQSTALNFIRQNRKIASPETHLNGMKYQYINKKPTAFDLSMVESCRGIDTWSQRIHFSLEYVSAVLASWLTKKVSTSAQRGFLWLWEPTLTYWVRRSSDWWIFKYVWGRSGMGAHLGFLLQGTGRKQFFWRRLAGLNGCGLWSAVNI